jgi:hypothetical protein
VHVNGHLIPNRSDPLEVIAAMMLMLAGITLSGLFIAFGASLLTRLYSVRLQGLRPVARREHIIVCGAGSIGTGVIDLLLALGKRLVVVERDPDTSIVERAHEHLGTGDQAGAPAVPTEKWPPCDGKLGSADHG